MQTTEGGEEKELETQNSENLAQKRQAEESGAEPESKVRRSVKNIVCVTEKDVGIEKYVSTSPGIRCVLKNSCDDFIVREIDKDGKVVDLVSEELPPEDQVEEDTMTEEEGWKRLHSLFDDAVCDSIASLLAQIQANSNTDAQCSLRAISSKETRREVHQIIRKAFPSLQSDTEGDVIVLRSAANPNHFHKTQRKQWPYPDRNYVEFTLKKRGKDTMSVINSICNACRRAAKAFTVYGTKDKRAITFQKVVAYRISPSELKTAVAKIRDISIGDFCYVNEPASIGKNRGNRFTITLRGLRANNPESSIEVLRSRLDETVASLRTAGYLNYYGLQRFGNRGYNISIGCHMLRSEWESAVLAILESSGKGETEKAAAKLRETGDGLEAMKLLPKSFQTESKLLRALGKSGGKGYSNALASIPYTRRTLYVHSVQSFLFNRMVSARIDLGMKLLPGDLVSPVSPVSPVSTSSSAESPSSASELSDKAEIIEITAENQEQYSMHELVLPLPGISTRIPANLADVYEKTMNELGLEKDCWSKAVREYQMHGSYRRMLLRPRDMEGSVNEEDDSVVLSFSLDSGCYATMLIREVTKYETDVKSQLSLF